MKASRYATSRQKACLRCSAAKVKCDRKSGRCSRCASKEFVCAYISGASHGLSILADGANTQSVSNNDPSFADSHESYHSATNSEALVYTYPRTGESTSESLLSSIESSVVPVLQVYHQVGPHKESTGVASDVVEADPPHGNTPVIDELCCPIDAEAIRNRWLNVYLPVAGQKTKVYPASITTFIYHILKAYTTLTTRGQGLPPFVHNSQMNSDLISQPLATCSTIVRMCEKPLPGSEDVATGILQHEMSKIHDQHDSYDGPGSLAAFQSYLIYSMVLFFRLGQSRNPMLREAMMNLQELACATSRRGLMCIAEREHARPRWEAWILMEAKRRTLYTMYLFDGVLSAHDDLPSALGIELTGLPAPSSKQLWQAETREEWETAYNAHLANSTGDLRIDELWPIPEGLDDAGCVARRCRIDTWLQYVDEYGTMLYAVTSCTHGA